VAKIEEVIDYNGQMSQTHFEKKFSSFDKKELENINF
jgi:hypothetical protein